MFAMYIIKVYPCVQIWTKCRLYTTWAANIYQLNMDLKSTMAFLKVDQIIGGQLDIVEQDANIHT